MPMNHCVLRRLLNPLKYITLSYLQIPLLNVQTVQSPSLIRKNHSQYIGFLCPLQPKKKTYDFSPLTSSHLSHPRPKAILTE